LCRNNLNSPEKIVYIQQLKPDLDKFIYILGQQLKKKNNSKHIFLFFTCSERLLCNNVLILLS